MNMIITDITEELIHAYVDSQLSPDERIQFEHIMKNDPELIEKVEAYKQQNALLHELFDSVLEEPIPSSLSTLPVNYKNSSILFKMVASFMLLFAGGLVGGITGWYANEQTPENPVFTASSIARAATIAHMVYVPEVKHPVEVAADQEKHLVKWLSKRLGNNINAPDLNPLGFGLVGGRLLPSENGAAAQLMYENNTGERLTLYIRNANTNEKTTAFRYYEETNANAFYWIDGNLGYVIVGDINKNQLLDTANTVYHQLSL